MRSTFMNTRSKFEEERLKPDSFVLVESPDLADQNQEFVRFADQENRYLSIKYRNTLKDAVQLFIYNYTHAKPIYLFFILVYIISLLGLSSANNIILAMVMASLITFSYYM